jgi:putative FmdB family regulatory protein
MPRLPTYEYHCDSCDKNFDVVQSFHDDALTECPTCGSPIRKVFGNVGIVFKGSGFYKTDSRDGGKKKAVVNDVGSSPTSDGDSSSSTIPESTSTPPASGDSSPDASPKKESVPATTPSSGSEKSSTSGSAKSH